MAKRCRRIKFEFVEDILIHMCKDFPNLNFLNIFNLMEISIAISKRYDILIHYGTQNRKSKSYRKV